MKSVSVVFRAYRRQFTE